jgi:excisionase family DNA binding protein
MNEINNIKPEPATPASAQTITEESAPANPAQEYLNKTEVAARLRKTVRTIDNWMARGILPYYKIGRTVSFRWSDVEGHMRENYRVCQRRSA